MPDLSSHAFLINHTLMRNCEFLFVFHLTWNILDSETQSVDFFCDLSAVDRRCVKQARNYFAQTPVLLAQDTHTYAVTIQCQVICDAHEYWRCEAAATEKKSTINWYDIVPILERINTNTISLASKLYSFSFILSYISTALMSAIFTFIAVVVAHRKKQHLLQFIQCLAYIKLNAFRFLTISLFFWSESYLFYGIYSVLFSINLLVIARK